MMEFGDIDLDKLDELFSKYDETMTAAQVAKLLKMKVESVRPLFKRDEDPIPAYEVGKHWLIIRDEFKEWLRRRSNAVTK